MLILLPLLRLLQPLIFHHPNLLLCCLTGYLTRADGISVLLFTDAVLLVIIHGLGVEQCNGEALNVMEDNLEALLTSAIGPLRI